MKGKARKIYVRYVLAEASILVKNHNLTRGNSLLHRLKPAGGRRALKHRRIETALVYDDWGIGRCGTGAFDTLLPRRVPVTPPLTLLRRRWGEKATMNRERLQHIAITLVSVVVVGTVAALIIVSMRQYQ